MPFEVNAGVLPKQFSFITSEEKQTAYIGGIGAGKTRASVYKAISMPLGAPGMLIAPTYGMLNDTLIRTFMEIAEPLIKKFDKGRYNMTLMDGKEILFRSADNPDKLRGPNLGWAGLDECALMNALTLDIVVGRLRRAPGKMWFTTTPKGKKHWLYEYVTKNDVELFEASSFDNPYLPDFYLNRLQKQYSDDFYRQEVLGRFVETGGTVFKGATYYDTLPVSFTRGYEVKIAFDAAYTARESSDDSVIVVGRKYQQDNKIYIVDFWKGKVNPQVLVDRLTYYQKTYRCPSFTRIGGTEISFVAWLEREGIKVRHEYTRGDKLTNAQSLIAAWNRGEFLLPHKSRKPWSIEAADDIEGYTGRKDERDDTVDAFTTLYNAFIKEPIKMRKF